MSSKNDYCVIGLGKFGISVVTTLQELGKVCLAIDKNSERAQLVAKIANDILILDATNRTALEDAGVHKIKNVIIAVGSDLAASVITAANILALQEKHNNDTEINIVAKAVDSTHQLLLKSIGISNIILPEIEAGKRAAYRAIWKLGLDLNTVNEKNSIVNVVVKNPHLINKTLKTLKIPKIYDINLIAIKRSGKVIIPKGDDKLFLNDEILFISNNENIGRVYNNFSLGATGSLAIDSKFKEKTSHHKKKAKKRKTGLFAKKKH